MIKLFGKDRTCNILILVFSISELVTNLISLDDNIINLIRVGIGLICSFYTIFTVPRLMREYTILFGGLFSILLYFSISYNSNANYINILWIWSYIGIGLLIYSKSISVNTAKLVLVLYTLVFIFNSLINHSVASELFSTGSANGVSVLYLYSIVLYCIAKYKQDKTSNIPYVPIIFLAFFSLWAANRSGVLTAGVLFIGAIINNIVVKGKRGKKGIFTLLLIALIVMYIGQGVLNGYTENMTNKYDRYGNESVRTLIWGEYILACINNVGYLLFGAPASDPNIIHYHFYNGNPHNSLLMLHAKFGLIAFVFAIYEILRFVIRNLKSHNFFLIVLFSGILTRSFFDWTSFPGLYDIFFWALVFFNRFSNPKIKRKDIS